MPEPDHDDVQAASDQPTKQATGASRRRIVLRRLALGAAVLLGLPLVLGLGLGTYLWVTTDVPPPGSVSNPQATVIRFDDGTEIARLSDENRISVPLDAVSQDAREAVLAAEDRGFYDGAGISPTGILRALWTNLRSGEVEQGGSTITQQYARNAFLSQERTWSRKAREAVIAVKLERSRSKDQVLERYLNTVYFGRGAYGIEAAANEYFDKHAIDLTASEGAVLASLLKSPSAYDPARNPELARERWLYTLRGMAEQGWLEQPVAAQEYPAVRPDTDDSTFGGPNGYLVQQVLRELEELGYSEAEVGVAGLLVDTTFDARAQELAVRAVHEVTGPQAPDGVYRALVSVEPGTGRVLASYSGRDYLARPFDAVTQGSAQAGSSFKPYVLAAALKDGISLRSRFDGSSPQEFGDDYEVKNYGSGDGQDFGRIDLLAATRSSVNTVYVPLGIEAGLGDVADTAASLGVTADMSAERGVPSISLGVTAVTPLDQANAYATLAAGGVRAQPYVVERITDRDGELVHEAEPSTERVLDPAIAADVTFALRQVVAEGTGEAAQLPDRPAAGKTGTTTDNTAAWFVGYTPRLATAVALYTERSDMSLQDIAGISSVTGGSLPARTWSTYMAAVLDPTEPLPFPEPEFVGSQVSPTPSAPETTAPPRRTRAPVTRAPAPTSSSPSPSPSPSPSASTSPPATSAGTTAEPSESSGPLEPVPDLGDPSQEPSEEPEPSDEPSREPSPSSEPEPSEEPEPSSEPSPQPSSEPSGTEPSPSTLPGAGTG